MKTWIMPRFALTLALAMCSLLIIAIPRVHASGNNCLWTGDGDGFSFSDAANWNNCGGNAPGAGDNLVFDNSAGGDACTNDDFDISDDLPGVTFGSLTFQGDNLCGDSDAQFLIAPETDGSSNNLNMTNVTLQLSGGITDTTNNTIARTDFASPLGIDEIDMPITLTGATNTITASSSLQLGDPLSTAAQGGNPNEIGVVPDDLNIGSNALTFSGTGTILSFEDFNGSGATTVNLTSNIGEFVQEDVSNPGYTGAVTIQSGLLDLQSTDTTYPDMLSAASSITVDSGATLYYDDGAAGNTTIPDILHTAGTGVANCASLTGTSLAECGAVLANFNNTNTTSTLTLSGAITLLADTILNSLESTNTIDITGALSGSFHAATTNGTLVINSSNNTSLTPNSNSGSQQAPGGNVNSATTLPSDSGGGLGTPDTGTALVVTRPLFVLVGALIAASSLIGLASRLKPGGRRGS